MTIPVKFLEKVERQQKCIDKIKEYEKRMTHKYSYAYYKNRALMFRRLKTPKWFFDKIVVKGEENVREVKDKQLLYVSNHTSLADFLVQGYVFWDYGLPIPRFLAGENLNRLVLGSFFRKCGAIFIDRNEKDRLYWNFEDNYIKERLLSRENLLVYPEGARKDSLSEKLKTGTLGQLIYAVKNRGDVFVVPIHIYYDKRIEEWVIDKGRENKERRDNLLKISRRLRAEGKNLAAKIIELKAEIRDKIYFHLDLFAYFVRLFDKQKGNAYVYFGKAFSLIEFLKGLEGTGGSEKIVLAQKVREEIARLENVYKASKSV